MSLDQQTKVDIELLLNVARQKVEAIDKVGSAKLFNEVSEEFGLVAHRVYLALDKPARTVDNYHNRSVNSVLLDPHTILNRANSYPIRDLGISIDEPEFWDHADMVKTFCDYLALTHNSEVSYGCA